MKLGQGCVSWYQKRCPNQPWYLKEYKEDLSYTVEDGPLYIHWFLLGLLTIIYALWNSNCYTYATWVMPNPHHTGQIRKYAPYTKITPSEMSYELSEYTHQHYKWLSAIVFCPILFIFTYSHHLRNKKYDLIRKGHILLSCFYSNVTVVFYNVICCCILSRAAHSYSMKMRNR